MNPLWCLAIVTSCTIGILSEQRGATASAMLGAGGEAVSLLVVLAGAMMLWGGLMEIMEETGDVERIGRGIRRVLRPLFPQLEDGEAWSAMGMNITANLLGMGNAATPAGIRAATLLEKQGAEGLRALGMLLVLNNSGLQLLPATVMALRAEAGAADPADIWAATLLSSGAATVVGAALMAAVNRWGTRHG